MDPTTIVCPVCTLFLRPGITLKQHLLSHPKQKVIDALVKLASAEDLQKASGTSSTSSNIINASSGSQVNPAVINHPWNISASISGQNPPTPTPSHLNPVHGNHVFIYQQSMSTTSPQPNVLHVNPLSQQYVYPAVFNPQLMPYVYQQQQVIMSSNSLPHPMKALPFDLSSSTQLENANKEDTNGSQNQEDNRIVEVQDNNITESAQESMPKESGNDTNAEEQLSFNQTFDYKQEMEVADHGLSNLKKYQLEMNENPSDTYTNTTEDGSSFDSNQDQNASALEVTEVCSSSPPGMSADWRAHSNSDLNKACQTQTSSNSPPRLQETEENEGFTETQENFEDQPEYLYVHSNTQPYSGNEEVEVYPNNPEMNLAYPTVKMNEHFEQSEPIYTSANILHGGDNFDFVNMDELVMSNFHSGHVISQVENFENIERPGVLMTIGEISCHKKNEYSDQKDFEESTSRGSSHLNIKSDERMPARGELSGQESLGGASDITWNRLQYQEGSSRMTNSFDSNGHDSWDGSDSEIVDLPCSKNILSSDVTYVQEQAAYDNENDTPMFISSSGPPLNFKCSICSKEFASGKERKEHEITEHSKVKVPIIGSEIGKKKVKKLVVKLKSDKNEHESAFNNVFTNKLKFETSTDSHLREVQVENIKTDVSTALDIADMKTVCTICDCVVENAKVLKLHKMEMHSDITKSKYKCSTCEESFPNEYKYTAHLRVHPLECKLCGKLFYRRQNIQLHMKRHLGLKPFSCEICKKSFVTKQKHDEHKNIHTGDAPIKCNLCDEKFKRYSNLVQHRNRHHLLMKKKIKDYICQCGEIFHSKKKLAWHKEIHESKPKACTQCNEKFLHMSSLTRHMRRAHNEKYLPDETRSNENVECPVCKGVYLKSSLEAHIRNHSGQRPYTCLICNKDFTTKWNLKLHKWTHASRTSKPYKCDQCKGAFIRESDYTAHMNSHKSVRPYTCNYCGAQFIRKYNCLRHVKEHVNDKTFNCQICGKSFHRSYYLKDHMRVHSGFRPYTCHICGKTSTTKSNHNKHIQIHHAREPVSTEN